MSGPYTERDIEVFLQSVDGEPRSLRTIRCRATTLERIVDILEGECKVPVGEVRWRFNGVWEVLRVAHLPLLPPNVEMLVVPAPSESTLPEIMRAWLSRDRLRVMLENGVAEGRVEGCFVRVYGQDGYILAKVRYWDVTGKLLVQCANGKGEQFDVQSVSNSQPRREDIRKWAEETQRSGLRLPTTQELDEAMRAFQEFEAEVEAQRSAAPASSSSSSSSSSSNPSCPPTPSPSRGLAPEQPVVFSHPHDLLTHPTATAMGDVILLVFTRRSGGDDPRALSCSRVMLRLPDLAPLPMTEIDISPRTGECAGGVVEWGGEYVIPFSAASSFYYLPSRDGVNFGCGVHPLFDPSEAVRGERHSCPRLVENNGVLHLFWMVEDGESAYIAHSFTRDVTMGKWSEGPRVPVESTGLTFSATRGVPKGLAAGTELPFASCATGCTILLSNRRVLVSQQDGYGVFSDIGILDLDGLGRELASPSLFRVGDEWWMVAGSEGSVAILRSVDDRSWRCPTRNIVGKFRRGRRRSSDHTLYSIPTS